MRYRYSGLIWRLVKKAQPVTIHCKRYGDVTFDPGHFNKLVKRGNIVAL